MAIDGSDTQSVAAEEQWQKALDKAFKAVVVLRGTSTRTFDTYTAGEFDLTGFIVDKKRGIILTTRYILQAGPVVVDATFFNGEEIPVYPLYRDPVHDFGFFRFDPAVLEFMKCEEIPLAPEAAAVGLEIRVVGNNGETEVSVMAGTLTQLNREAPSYECDEYSDFNTFYMLAALATKEETVGSPAIDCRGQAVALTAGCEEESFCSFFLPLDRVVRALRIIQRCKDEGEDECNIEVHIPRGTLQMTLVHKAFDEARGLGLQPKTEQLVREALPTETGLLAIDSVIPGGPADKMQLETGDLLVRVNAEIVTNFLKLETLLDDYVGYNIYLEVERGGVLVCGTLDVQDLYSIIPHYFLEISGGVIHPLSYQQARNLSFKCGLVYVAEPGLMLSRARVPRRAIIKKLDGKEVTQVQDFITILLGAPRGTDFHLEFVSPEGHSKTVPVHVDRHDWYGEPGLYTRDDATGLWKRMPVTACFSISSAFRENIKLERSVTSNLFDSIGMTYSQTFCSDDAEKAIEPALVIVETFIPPIISHDGGKCKRFHGTGLVIYHSKTMGIVVVDKYTVPSYIADVTVAFGVLAMHIHAEVVFLHPLHNYALVAYNPAWLGEVGFAAVHAAALRPESTLHMGDAVYLIGLNGELQAKSRKSIVRNPVAALNIGKFASPHYRAMNMEVIELDADFGNSFSGVLADEHGGVQALWGIFSKQVGNDIWKFVRGIPIYSINEVLQKIIYGTKGPRLLINGIHKHMPLVRILGVELDARELSEARLFGLTERWATKLARKDPVRRQVLWVKLCFAGSQAQRMLEQGDMLLAIDGEPITSFREIENACQRLDLDGCQNQEGNLRMTILRRGLEMELLVGTDVRDGFGTTHIFSWCGCLAQKPHLAVASSGFLPAEGHGVYLSDVFAGTPCQRYGLDGLNLWIVEVNGKPTPDLQTFVDVTKELEDDKFVRVKTIGLDGKPLVFTLKQDLHYWPTWELTFDPETATWSRKTIKDRSECQILQHG